MKKIILVILAFITLFFNSSFAMECLVDTQPIQAQTDSAQITTELVAITENDKYFFPVNRFIEMFRSPSPNREKPECLLEEEYCSFIDTMKLIEKNGEIKEIFYDFIVEKLKSLMITVGSMNPGDIGYEEFRNEPKMPLKNWVISINQIGKFPAFVNLVSFFYMKKIQSIYPNLKISNINIYRLFLMSCLVAQKVCMDIVYKNKDWFIIGGRYYTNQKINIMELEFLNLLNFDLSFNEVEILNLVKEFDNYRNHRAELNRENELIRYFRDLAVE